MTYVKFLHKIIIIILVIIPVSLRKSYATDILSLNSYIYVFFYLKLKKYSYRSAYYEVAIVVTKV